MRFISAGFKQDLQQGILHPFLDLVLRDATLCLEIRDSSINIYYRGGSLLRIDDAGNRSYYAVFDEKYILESAFSTALKNRLYPLNKKLIYEKEHSESWIKLIPYLKHSMDLYFGRYPKNEREFQQLMVRENNFGGAARGTDYYICDIEYAGSEGRFDMIAVNWPSTSSERKGADNLGLAFIEMKYLDHALKNTSGILQHIQDLDCFLKKRDLAAFQDEMKRVFNTKRELGLIHHSRNIRSFREGRPEFIMVIANHDPASSILRTELNQLQQGISQYKTFDLKFAVSNFMGYGLYNENIYPFEEFLARFDAQI